MHSPTRTYQVSQTVNREGSKRDYDIVGGDRIGGNVGCHFLTRTSRYLATDTEVSEVSESLRITDTRIRVGWKMEIKICKYVRDEERSWSRNFKRCRLKQTRNFICKGDSLKLVFRVMKNFALHKTEIECDRDKAAFLSLPRFIRY